MIATTLKYWVFQNDCHYFKVLGVLESLPLLSIIGCFRMIATTFNYWAFQNDWHFFKVLSVSE